MCHGFEEIRATQSVTIPIFRILVTDSNFSHQFKNYFSFFIYKNLYKNLCKVVGSKYEVQFISRKSITYNRIGKDKGTKKKFQKYLDTSPNNIILNNDDK